VNVVLEVLDRDRNVLLSANGGGEGEGERIPNLRVSGDVWVRVSASKKGTGGAYVLKIRFRPPPAGAELEPNDRAADATPLGVLPPDAPLRVTGIIGHAADEDWYRVDLVEAAPPPPLVAVAPSDAGDAAAVAPVPADGGAALAANDAGVQDGGAVTEEARQALRLEVTAVPGVRLELQVLSAAQAPLFEARGKESEGLSLRNVAVRASDTTLFVVVKSSWVGSGKEAKRSGNPEVPYTLTIGREAAGADAEYEPNDELAKATPLTRGGHREGFLSPRGDIDYYVVRSEEPGLTQFQVTGVERVDLVMSVVKPGADGGPETVLLTANDGAVKEPEILNNVKCAPECYVKIQSAVRKGENNQPVRDYENSEQSYRLSANVVPPGNYEVEPNNTPEQATPLVLGQPVRGTIHPKKDVDYYRLDLSDRPVKTSITATATGILKVDVGLYLYALDEDGKAELVQTADRAKGEAPEVIHYSAEPGVYLLVVKDAKNRESNFQDSYQLAVVEGG
jgi:hypothetical protein